MGMLVDLYEEIVLLFPNTQYSTFYICKQISVNLNSLRLMDKRKLSHNLFTQICAANLLFYWP